MLSSSAVRRFTPWPYALKTLRQAHSEFNYPPPEAACKIMFDTAGMPPHIKLILYSILRSRHLLLCVEQRSPDKSPVSSTLRAYASALRAASKIYSEDPFYSSKPSFRQDFPLISTLTVDPKHIPKELNMWNPVSPESAKKNSSRAELLLQSTISDEFAQFQRKSQERRYEVKQVLQKDRKKLNKRQRKRLNRINASSTDEQQQLTVEHKLQPSSVFAPPMSGLSRIRFADDTSALVAEVWSNIQSDGIFKIVQDIITLSKQQLLDPTVNATILNDETKMNVHFQKLRGAGEILLSLLESKDHLLFNDETLHEVFHVTFELLTVLSSASALITSKTSSPSSILPKGLLFLFAQLSAALSSSLRMRGGITSGARMTKFLLQAHELVISSARYQHVASHVAVAQVEDVILPLVIVFELTALLQKKDAPEFDELIITKFIQSIKIVSEECDILLQRQKIEFERRLGEVDDLVKEIESKSEDNKTGGVNDKKKRDLIATLEKRESYLHEVVKRDANLHSSISVATHNEIIKLTKLIARSRNCDVKKKMDLVHYCTKIISSEDANKNTSHQESNIKILDDLKAEIAKHQQQERKLSPPSSIIFEFNQVYPNKNAAGEKFEEATPLTCGLHVVDDSSSKVNESNDLKFGTFELASSNSMNINNIQRKRKSIVLFSKSDVQKLLRHREIENVPSTSLLFLRWLVHDAQNCLSPALSSAQSGSTNKKDDSNGKKEQNAPTQLQQQQEQNALLLKKKRFAFFKGTETSSIETLFSSSRLINNNSKHKSGMPIRKHRKSPRTFCFPTSASSTVQETIQVIAPHPRDFDQENIEKVLAQRAQDYLFLQVVTDCETTDLTTLFKNKVGLEPVKIVVCEEVFGDESFVFVDSLNKALGEI